jgi:hypothetical protein
MSLSIEEQELNINASRDEEFATAYCSDRTWITKFDRLVAKSPTLFEVIAETEDSKTYRFPKRLISIRSTIREMSDEQKAIASDRFKKMHSQRYKSSINQF